ncbi:MAG: cytochrome c oxidase subunit 3 [Neomegalonema sp.]|nr:cytochrome c oxidase subunit 3 [Neomegalonema sp.]
MADHKQHDYHIVDPSPWPMLASLGTFAMLGGMVLYMHGSGPWVALAGLALILYVMYAWWADVVKESHAGEHTPVVRIGLRYGVILFIISEVMFFVAWFWSYFKHFFYPMMGADGFSGVGGVDGVFPPEGIQLVDPWHLPLLNTLILLTSGCAVTWAHHAIMENDRKGLINGLAIAVVLGMIFTAVQAYEYYEIAFSFSENVYANNFFMATGFHGFHVIVGTIFLAICLIRAIRGHFSAEAHVGFEAAAWYWHFVDVVWLFLFFAIYVGSWYA